MNHVHFEVPQYSHRVTAAFEAAEDTVWRNAGFVSTEIESLMDLSMCIFAVSSANRHYRGQYRSLPANYYIKRQKSGETHFSVNANPSVFPEDGRS